MNSVEQNVAREQYSQNNTNLMKNVLYSSQVALEQFKHKVDPEVHPVNNNLVPQRKRWLAIAGTSLYSIDLAKNM